MFDTFFVLLIHASKLSYQANDVQNVGHLWAEISGNLTLMAAKGRQKQIRTL